MDFVKIILKGDGTFLEEPAETDYGYNRDVFHYYNSSGVSYFVIYPKGKVKEGKNKLFKYLIKELKSQIIPLQKELDTINDAYKNM
jgi:hypothetical protein